MPQPLGQAVSQGRWDVLVGVVGQAVLGPGRVVVLSRLSMVMHWVWAGCEEATYVSIRHSGTMHGLVGVKIGQEGSEM